MKLLALLVALGIGAVAHPQPNDAASTLESRQTCSGPIESNPSTWWRAAIDHNGTAPTSSDPTFQYYRTAVQYGADNTGVRDSSDAFNFAIEGTCVCARARAKSCLQRLRYQHNLTDTVRQHGPARATP